MISKTYISSLILLITLTLFSGCQSDQNGRTMLRIGNKQYQKKQYNDSESSYLKSIEKNNMEEATAPNAYHHLYQATSCRQWILFQWHPINLP